jgi:hypothetical protein
MIAITTSSSTSVKARRAGRCPPKIDRTIYFTLPNKKQKIPIHHHEELQGGSDEMLGVQRRRKRIKNSNRCRAVLWTQTFPLTPYFEFWPVVRDGSLVLI